MKFRYISNDRNPKRVWPLTSKDGVVVMVPSSHYIETEHDLSEWVISGLIKGLPANTPIEVAVVAQLIAPVPVPTSQSKNPYESMAKAMESAFNKAVVVAPPAVVEPAPAPAPVVEEAVEVLSDEAAIEAHIDAVVPVGEDADFALLTRKVLWGLASERGLTADLEYRSSTKAELIRLLNGEE